MTTETDLTIIQKLCIKAKENAEVLNVKGKARETANMAFWNGAVMALDAVGDSGNRYWVHRFTAMLIAVRGYDEVLRVIKEIEEKVDA